MSDISDISDTSDTSDSFQQEWQEVLDQFLHIEQLHTDILGRLTTLHVQLQTHPTNTIIYNERSLDTILDELHAESLKEIEATGQNPFYSLLSAALEKATHKEGNT